jgi:hypothetical protein
MKSLVNIAVNYGKTLKSCEEDTNIESVYAELSVILSEPKYIHVEGGVKRKTEISEVEFGVSKEGAKRMIAIMKDIHSKLVKLEKENKPVN